MLLYLARRLVLLVLVVLGMSLITFSLTHLVPGNPARLIAGQRATQEQVDAVIRRYGLDQPLYEQYTTYMSGLLEGSFGQSMTTRRPVNDDIAQFLPATIELTLSAVILTGVFGIPLGLLAAVNRGRIADHIIRIFTIAGVSMPIFWLGIILQIIFYRWLDILPVGGRLAIIDIPPPHVTGMYTIDSLIAGDWTTFRSALIHLILPASTLAVGSLAVITRMTRTSTLEVLNADYILAARAKGLKGLTILRRHVLKNAMIPTTTVFGLQIGFLLAGNILTEVVFNWPGIGLYAVKAISYLDYSAIIAVTIIISLIYVVVNFIVDGLYLLLDPRISYRAQK